MFKLLFTFKLNFYILFLLHCFQSKYHVHKCYTGINTFLHHLSCAIFLLNESNVIQCIYFLWIIPMLFGLLLTCAHIFLIFLYVNNLLYSLHMLYIIIS